jgi:hypothetical protein
VQPGEELDSVGPLTDDGPDLGRDASENDENRWSVISVSKVEHKFVFLKLPPFILYPLGLSDIITDLQ